MRAALRSVQFDPDPRELPADPAKFSFLVTMTVGPAGGAGEETFSVQVCTPEWLAKRCQSEGYVDGRHIIVTSIGGYSEHGLRSFLTKRVEQVTAETWRDVAEKVSRIGYWEFEDYQE